MSMTIEQEQDLETFSKFEELTQKVLALVCMLCTEWGITVKAFYEVVEGLLEAPACKVQAELQALAIGRWIQLSGHEVNSFHEIAITLEDGGVLKDIVVNYILDITRILIDKTKTTPFDDLREKKPFFIMSVAVLRYFLRNDCLTYGSVGELYGELVVNVSKNVGLTSTLGNVQSIYDLPIYNFLQYGLDHVNDFCPVATQIRIQMGYYHSSVFDYEKSDELADIAHKGIVREGMKSSTVDWYNLQSAIFENKSLYGEALCYSRMAFVLNEQLHGEGCIDNIPVLLQMCNLTLCLDKAACKRLFDQIPDLPKYSEGYIKKLLIEAELYDEIEISLQLIEQAQTISFQVFNVVLPYIYSSLTKIYGRKGLYEEGLDANNRYIKVIRQLYGATTHGDLNLYYSCKIISNLSCGLITTAASLTKFVIDYCPASPTYCFEIRAYHYLAIANSYCYATQEYDLAEAYASAVVEEIEKNLPSSQVIDTIAPLFDSIPSCVFFYDFIRTAYHVKIDCAIEKGEIEMAEQLCFECLARIDGREAYWIQAVLGRIYVMQGRIDEGIDVWKKAINDAGNDAVDIADEVAKYAYDAFLTDFAMEVIDEASKKKPLSGYSNYLTFAEICDSACQYEMRDNLYRQALQASLSNRQKARCLYAMAMNNQDSEAVTRLENAIRLSNPDPSLCYDEEISKFYKQLADCQNSLSLLSNARQSAKEAVRYAPTEEPGFFEEIEDIL